MDDGFGDDIGGGGGGGTQESALIAANEIKGRTKVWSIHKTLSPAKRASQCFSV